MTDPTSSELTLDGLPRPPVFRLVDAEGYDVHAGVVVGGEPATVAALFEDEDLAREFSAGAGEYGMEALAGRGTRELADWGAMEVFAAAGEGYVLVVARDGTGLFHADDVARRAAEEGVAVPLPLYVITGEGGEAPLITVETGGEEAVVVTALFGTPEGARAFREAAPHLGLPEGLGRIDDRDGLRRHALVAKGAGAGYAVVDPGPGMASEAIPLEDWIQ